MQPVGNYTVIDVRGPILTVGGTILWAGVPGIYKLEKVG